MTAEAFLARRRLAQCLVLAPAALLAGPAWPQVLFPSRPVRLVVPFPPGGASDAMMRVLALQLQERWKQPVVVENKPGAGTVIGSNAVAKASPDGYTLGLVTASHAINAAARRDLLPYDTLKDFAAVSQVAAIHQAIFVRTDSPLNTVRQLVDASRTRRITYATSGTGTAGHLFGELLNSMTGSALVHVPYRGSSPAQTDLLAGHVDVLVDAMSAQQQMVKAGRMRVVALVSPQRHPGYPQLPTAAETYSGASVESFFGIVVASGTPRVLVQQLSRDIGAALQVPGVHRQIEDLGLLPLGTTPEQFDTLVRSEIQKCTALIQRTGLKID